MTISTKTKLGRTVIVHYDSDREDGQVYAFVGNLDKYEASIIDGHLHIQRLVSLTKLQDQGRTYELVRGDIPIHIAQKNNAANIEHYLLNHGGIDNKERAAKMASGIWDFFANERFLK